MSDHATIEFPGLGGEKRSMRANGSILLEATEGGYRVWAFQGNRADSVSRPAKDAADLAAIIEAAREEGASA